MAIRIDKKIIDYEVKAREEPHLDSTGAQPHSRPKAEVIQMHERLERPEMLLGSTYKIKTPLSEHALYVTINDVVLNVDTEHEQRRPFEVFINSKNMEHFQWIVALTRIISAVFRKGGDVAFLAEEMRAVFDPRGGYFKKGGRYMPSLVAEIGEAIESHLRIIGLLDEELDKHQHALIAAKKDTLHAVRDSDNQDRDFRRFPDSARVCAKCHTKAVVSMDGCMTCLNCADSKCG